MVSPTPDGVLRDTVRPFAPALIEVAANLLHKLKPPYNLPPYEPSGKLSRKFS